MLLPAGAASAHTPLPPNLYKCFNASYTEYTQRDLRIRKNQEYAFQKATGEVLGKPGKSRHPSDTNKIRFTSGYLDNNGWRATHSNSGGIHRVTLKRDTNGGTTVNICEPQSG